MQPAAPPSDEAADAAAETEEEQATEQAMELEEPIEEPPSPKDAALADADEPAAQQAPADPSPQEA